jgi:branched-chain amino acid transport system ATP-binding protein
MSIAAQGLVVEQVTRDFGGLKALDQVSLEVPLGHVQALIGPNGAGKSTLINVVSGFLPAQAGRIWLQGERIDHLTAPERVRRGLVRTFQDVRGFARLTVLENVLLGAHLHLPHGLSQPLTRPRWVREMVRRSQEEAERLLAEVGLLEDRDVPVSRLPFGKLRLLGLVRVMAARPTVVLLDEPGAGLHAQEAAPLIRAIDRLRQQGVGVLLVEHHMSLVEALADRVTVLNFGQVIAVGTWDEVRRDPSVRQAYLGRGHAETG